MKKYTRPALLLAFAAMAAGLFGCAGSRGITPHQAANGKAKCGRYIR